MKLSFHPGVQSDVNAILAYYDEQGGERLADRFYEDLTARFQDILEHPHRFPFYLGNQVKRRIRLHRFPYLILYRILSDRVRVTVVKHEKRHPNYGLGRR